jgi:hypothetical protein
MMVSIAMDTFLIIENPSGMQYTMFQFSAAEHCFSFQFLIKIISMYSKKITYGTKKAWIMLHFHDLKNRRGHLPRQVHALSTTTTQWYNAILSTNFTILLRFTLTLSLYVHVVGLWTLGALFWCPVSRGKSHVSRFLCFFMFLVVIFH